MKDKRAFTDATVNGTQIGSFPLRLFGAHLLTEYFTNPSVTMPINLILYEYRTSTETEEESQKTLFFAFLDALREDAICFLKELYGDENVNEFDYTFDGEEE